MTFGDITVVLVDTIKVLDLKFKLRLTHIQAFKTAAALIVGVVRHLQIHLPVGCPAHVTRAFQVGFGAAAAIFLIIRINDAARAVHGVGMACALLAAGLLCESIFPF